MRPDQGLVRIASHIYRFPFPACLAAYSVFHLHCQLSILLSVAPSSRYRLLFEFPLFRGYSPRLGNRPVWTLAIARLLLSYSVIGDTYTSSRDKEKVFSSPAEQSEISRGGSSHSSLARSISLSLSLPSFLSLENFHSFPDMTPCMTRSVRPSVRRVPTDRQSIAELEREREKFLPGRNRRTA